MEVYYSQNGPRGVNADSEIVYDRTYVKEMTALIRKYAKVRTTSAEFKSQFFDLLFKNCFEKLNRRLSTLGSSCYIQAHDFNINSIIDEIRTIITEEIFVKNNMHES